MVRVRVGGTAAVVSGAVVVALSWRQYLDQDGIGLRWRYLSVGAGALVGVVVRHDDLLVFVMSCGKLLRCLRLVSVAESRRPL